MIHDFKYFRIKAVRITALVGVLLFIAIPNQCHAEESPETESKKISDSKETAAPMDLPTDPSALLSTGNTLLNRGRYERALSCFLPGSALDPAAALGAGLCYWKQGKSAQAAPLLRRAKAAFPDNMDLRNALFEVNKAEIQRLSEKILWTKAQPAKIDIYRQLAALNEENWEYAESARTFACSLSSKPDYYSLIRAGYLYKLAKSYRTAANYYLQAAKVSTSPHFATMWAIDCLLLDNQTQPAEGLLNYLQGKNPGPDLEWYWARLHRAKGNKDEAERTLRALGKFYEKEVRARHDVRNNRLNAAKAYVEGGDPKRGLAMLGRMSAGSTFPDADIDAVRAQYYFENKNYLSAISIYRRYPDSVAMQVSLGWALVYSRNPAAAQRHFQILMKRFPHRPEVMEGWRACGNYRTWGAFYIFTRLDYGDYQDTRDLQTAMVDYAGEKAHCTFSYTNTSTNASKDAFDFGENLYGIRLYRRLGESAGAQIHGLSFQNNDILTDNGFIIGGKYYRQGRPKCHWNAELDASLYPELSSIQASVGMNYRLATNWTGLVGIDMGFLQGNDAARAETRTPASLWSAISLQDHNATVTLTGRFGERILTVDSDGLYAYNGLDTYHEGASLMILQKAQNLELFLNLGTQRVTSTIVRSAKFPILVSGSVDYYVKTIGLGGNFKFF
ncbi:hypothetical protein AUK22_03685 [bacterium CG2_30_54_10]|nr:MAG: hypothetical protein AUK22_03685 [bacterium CG2_30_54_10]